jgi:hypothetical protein
MTVFVSKETLAKNRWFELRGDRMTLYIEGQVWAVVLMTAGDVLVIKHPKTLTLSDEAYACMLFDTEEAALNYRQSIPINL